MGTKIRRLAAFLGGTALTWAFAVKPRLWNKPDMGDLRRYDYAHKGYFDKKKGIPENSLAACRAAVEHGYGIAVDVRITRDGIPVLFADARLDRLTGTNGTVENSTYAELLELRLSGTEETIPMLQSVLEMVDGQVPVLLDLRVEDDPDSVLYDFHLRVEDLETLDAMAAAGVDMLLGRLEIFPFLIMLAPRTWRR